MPANTYHSLTADDAFALLERRHDGKVHTIGRVCGCDWDRTSAERFLWNAESIQWEEHYTGHNVRALAPDGRSIRFATEPGKRPEDAAILKAEPFTPDPLGELRRIVATDGLDLHGLEPGNGEWVVRVKDGKIVEWVRKA